MPDFYQATMDSLNWAKDNPFCAIAGPLATLFTTSCSMDSLATASTIPAPVIPTPAAPRSVAELSSGMWTPDDVLTQTWAKYKDARTLQEVNMRNGNFAGAPAGTDDKSDYTPLWFVGGLAVLGVLAVKGLVR